MEALRIRISGNRWRLAVALGEEVGELDDRTDPILPDRSKSEKESCWTCELTVLLSDEEAMVVVGSRKTRGQIVRHLRRNDNAQRVSVILGSPVSTERN